MEQKLVYDIEKIKSGISMSSIVSLYDQINSEGNVLCPFHQDHTPSLHVYPDGAFCFTCRTRCDHISYVQAKEEISFLAAIKFLADKIGILPEAEAKKKNDYRGPVPLTIIKHWHSQLSEEKRKYLHDRLITDETIDTNLIGYAQDREAYSIPFWSGFPGHSDAEIVQFRATPEHKQDGKRYFGYKFHNCPSIINRNLINDELCVILFGTLDATLAAQDGIPCISTNGSTVFDDPERDEFKNLKKLLLKTKNIIVVPDGTISEFVSGQRLADHLGGIVKYFPKDTVKDYTDWRLSGRTSQEFMEMIDMSEFLYFVDTDHIQRIRDIVDLIAEGNGEGAFTVLQVIVTEGKYTSGLISRNIQWECGRKPYTDNTFTSDEWLQMAQEFFEASGYHQLSQVMYKWSNLAESKQGVF